jgi:signal transduction histidine kinase
MPFMFACVYTANTASLFLPISGGDLTAENPEGEGATFRLRLPRG